MIGFGVTPPGFGLSPFGDPLSPFAIVVLRLQAVNAIAAYPFSSIGAASLLLEDTLATSAAAIGTINTHPSVMMLGLSITDADDVNMIGTMV